MKSDLERDRLASFADARGFTGNEAIAFMKRNGYDMTRTAYWALLTRIKNRTDQTMRRKALDFQSDHIKRLTTLEAIGNKLWDIVDNSTSQYAKVKACEVLITLQDRIAAYSEMTAIVMEEQARVNKLALSSS